MNSTCNRITTEEVCIIASHSDVPFDVLIFTWQCSFRLCSIRALDNFTNRIKRNMERFSSSSQQSQILQILASVLCNAFEGGIEEILKIYLDSDDACETLNSFFTHWDDVNFIFSPLIYSLTREEREDNCTQIEAILNRIPSLARCRDEYGSTPLNLAIKNKNTAMVKTILNSKGADLSANHDGSQMTSLHLACSLGLYDIVALLLARIGPDAGLSSTTHPLHLSYKYGSITKLILFNNPPPQFEPRDDDQKTPLHISSQHPDAYESTRHFLRTGYNPAALDAFGCIPLHYASKHLDFRTAELLISANRGLINAANNLNFTPLMIAVDSANTRGSEILLSNGANPNPDRCDHYIPLYNSARKRLTNICLALLEYGADPNVTVSFEGVNESPLHVASREGFLETVEALLAYGAIPYTSNSNLSTPLHFAAEQGHISIVKLLTRHISNTEATKIRNQTSSRFKNAKVKNSPLYPSNPYEKIPLMEYLNKFDSNRHTALMNAIRGSGDNVETIKYLISSGTDLNLQNGRGETALHLALKLQKIGYVEYLLERYPEIDFTLKDGEGKTVIDLTTCLSLGE
ncbi:hypothetical protein HK098_008208 [Nowakowskiella sp. JEL0407]|nr:hypothetical protein HK098_008208 [Nowakowskiella sp. JEL0407]